MKVYIIEILNSNNQWEIYQRVAFTKKSDAEKVVKIIKNKDTLITPLKLK